MHNIPCQLNLVSKTKIKAKEPQNRNDKIGIKL
jgi:hypothetical protein